MDRVGGAGRYGLPEAAPPSWRSPSRWPPQRGPTRVYGKCLAATSTHRAPWFVVPADDKRNARLIISKILLDTFLALDLKFPETTQARRGELAAMRAQLAKKERIK